MLELGKSHACLPSRCHRHRYCHRHHRRYNCHLHCHRPITATISAATVAVAAISVIPVAVAVVTGDDSDRRAWLAEEPATSAGTQSLPTCIPYQTSSRRDREGRCSRRRRWRVRDSDGGAGQLMRGQGPRAWWEGGGKEKGNGRGGGRKEVEGTESDRDGRTRWESK